MTVLDIARTLTFVSYHHLVASYRTRKKGNYFKDNMLNSGAYVMWKRLHKIYLRRHSDVPF